MAIVHHPTPMQRVNRTFFVHGQRDTPASVDCTVLDSDGKEIAEAKYTPNGQDNSWNIKVVLPKNTPAGAYTIAFEVTRVLAGKGKRLRAEKVPEPIRIQLTAGSAAIPLPPLINSPSPGDAIPFPFTASGVSNSDIQSAVLHTTDGQSVWSAVGTPIKIDADGNWSATINVAGAQAPPVGGTTLYILDVTNAALSSSVDNLTISP